MISYYIILGHIFYFLLNINSLKEGLDFAPCTSITSKEHLLFLRTLSKELFRDSSFATIILPAHDGADKMIGRYSSTYIFY